MKYNKHKILRTVFSPLFLPQKCEINDRNFFEKVVDIEILK